MCKKASGEVGDEGCLAAEEMGGAGNVEHQAGVAIERDERCVALGPGGDRFQYCRVSGGVFVGNHQRRYHGASIGERGAASQAETGGGLVDRDEAEGDLILATTARGSSARAEAAALFLAGEGGVVWLWTERHDLPLFWRWRRSVER